MFRLCGGLKVLAALLVFSLARPGFSALASSPRRINYNDVYISGLGKSDLHLTRPGPDYMPGYYVDSSGVYHRAEEPAEKAPAAEELPPELAALLRQGSPEELERALTGGRLQFPADNQGAKTPLMYAAEKNPDPLVIRKLIEAGAGVNQIDARGYAALDYAAAANPEPLVLRELVRAGANTAKRINLSPAYDDSGGIYLIDYSPLTLALLRNPRPEAVRELVALGFSPNEADRVGSLPIHTFLDAHYKSSWQSNKNPEPAPPANLEALIDGGADLEKTKTGGVSPLGQAILNSNLQMTELLIRRGADVNRQGWMLIFPELPAIPYNPLFLAVFENLHDDENNSSILKALLEAGADPNHDLGKNLMALDFHLATNAKEDWTKLLLKHGARASGRVGPGGGSEGASQVDRLISEIFFNNSEPCILCRAIGEGFSTATIEKIIKSGTPGLKDAYGSGPLFTAIEENRPDVLKLLLENGVGGLWQSDMELALAAVRNDSPEMLGLLLENGAAVDGLSGTCPECPPIIIMCLDHRSQAEALTREILTKARQLDLNVIAEGWGTSPLRLAVFMGRPDWVEQMLKRGADPHMKNEDGETALDLAREKGDQKMIDLLSAGAGRTGNSAPASLAH